MSKEAWLADPDRRRRLSSAGGRLSAGGAGAEVALLWQAGRSQCSASLWMLKPTPTAARSVSLIAEVRQMVRHGST